MAQRLQLQTDLEAILESDKVYFQPPSNYVLSYPCIIYSRTDIHSQSANNRPYKKLNQYKITVIDADPDSAIPDKIADLSRCVFDRAFTVDRLNHNIFTILY